MLGAWLLQKYAHGVYAFESPPDIVRSAILAGFLSPAVSATVGATSLLLGHYASPEQFVVIWLTWWMGDATGILIVTPAILLWAGHPHIAWTRRQRLELGCLLLALVVTCAAIFGPLMNTGHKYPPHFLIRLRTGRGRGSCRTWPILPKGL